MIVHPEVWQRSAWPDYEASTHGRVRRVGGLPLRPHLRKRDGRHYVSLCRRGSRVLRGVHQVVASAFLGPCPPGLEVNHIDGDKTNNVAANLEYVTHQENCAHAQRLGLVRSSPCRGEKNGNAKLNEDAVREIRRLRAAGSTFAAIASRFNVSLGAVWWITSGKQWRHTA